MKSLLLLLLLIIIASLHANPNRYLSSEILSTSTTKYRIIRDSLSTEISGGSTLGSGIRTSDDDDGDDEEEVDEEDDDGEFGRRDNENGNGNFGSSSSAGEDGHSAKVQFMVTGRMRQVLTEELGYLPSEVDMIEPQIAAVVIERGLARPSAGMPASWRKTNVARAVARRPNNKGFSIVSNIVKTLRRPVAMIPILTTAAYLMIQSGSLGPLPTFKFPKMKKRKTNYNVLSTTSSSSIPSSGSKKKNVGVDLHSIESMQGKGYNTWLDKMR